MGIIGHYLFLSICGFLTGLLCLALGFLVLHANPRSPSCRVAFVFNLGAAIWGIFYGAMYLSKDDPLGILVSQTLNLGGILLSVSFTHLVLLIVKKDKENKTLIISDYLIAALLSWFLFTSPDMIVGSPPKLDFPSYSEPGRFYFFTPLFLFANIFFSLFHLIKGRQTAKGHRRNTLSLLLIVALVGYSSGTATYFLVFNIPIKPITTPLVALYPLILTYAIIKHHFLDIQKLVKRTLIFSLLFLMLLMLASLILFILKEVISRWIGIPTGLSQAIAIALAIALYNPLKTWLSQITNHMLFQHAQNPEIIFRRLSYDIFHLINTEALINEVTHRVAEILALDRIGFYLRSRKVPQVFELESKIGRIRKKQIHQTNQIIRHLEITRDFLVNPHTQSETRTRLKQKEPLDPTDVKNIKKQAVMELSEIGGVAAFPVFVQNTLHAILVIGRKKSDAPWAEEEFHILKSLIRHAALALGNAEYAEEIRQSREKISQSERDASAGALIAGVEHEVKNPLSAISLNITTLRDNLSDQKFRSLAPELIRDEITEIANLTRQYVERIDNIICHLSDLAHSKPLTIQEGIHPYVIAEKAIQMLKVNDGNAKTHVLNHISPNLTIACDPDALHEIFVNLIRNAEQAITGEGQIILEGLTVKGETIIRLKDTGSGVDPKNLTKIFEPFYTTKRRKQSNKTIGSGMGLFIVNQLMLGMGGHVTAESRLGCGSEFNLHFPGLEPSFGRAA